MKHETWTTKGSPTPYEKLLVCDKCQSSRWFMHSNSVQYCLEGHGRLREGTKQEYVDAKKELKFII